MFRSEGIEEEEVFLLFCNCKFKISLEVIIQLEENLESCLESLKSQIVQLVQPSSEVSSQDVPDIEGMFFRKTQFFYSLMINAKDLSLQVPYISFLSWFIVQSSLWYIDRRLHP